MSSEKKSVKKSKELTLDDLGMMPVKNGKTITLADMGMKPVKKNNSNEFDKLLAFKQYIGQAIDTYIEDFDPKSKENQNLGKILKATIAYNERIQKTYKPADSSDESD